MKVILMPNPDIDIGIFLILSLYFLGNKLLELAKEAKDQYFTTKDKVISENEFRVKVSTDMANIMAQVNTINVKIGESSLNLLNRKKL